MLPTGIIKGSQYGNAGVLISLKSQSKTQRRIFTTAHGNENDFLKHLLTFTDYRLDYKKRKGLSNSSKPKSIEGFSLRVERSNMKSSSANLYPGGKNPLFFKNFSNFLGFTE